MAIDELALNDFGILKPAWQRDAACKGMDIELFFPARGDSTREARETCARCRVAVECLDYIIETTPESRDHGIWGGTSPKDRKGVRKARRRRAAVS